MSGTENPMGNMMVAREDRMTEIEGRLEHIFKESFEAKITLVGELTNSEAGPLGVDDGASLPLRVDHDCDGGDGGDAPGKHDHEGDDPGEGQAPVQLALLAPAVNGETGEEDTNPRIAFKQIIIVLVRSSNLPRSFKFKFVAPGAAKEVQLSDLTCQWP